LQQQIHFYHSDSFLDRTEIIQIAGYTLEEKIEIAKRHLIKKQQEENGLDTKSFKLGNAELKHIIEAHTSESGVRTLEKRIAGIARWVALQTALVKITILKFLWKK
jgi:ATP-dependent Lon protease